MIDLQRELFWMVTETPQSDTERANQIRGVIVALSDAMEALDPALDLADGIDPNA
jgi:hypothetical protein